MEYGFISVENGTKTSLTNQVNNYKSKADDFKKAIKEKTPGVTQEMLNQANSMVSAAENELSTFKSKAYNQTQQAGTQAVEGLKSKIPDAQNAANNLVYELEQPLKNLNTERYGKSFVDGFSWGIRSNLKTAIDASNDMANEARTALLDKLGIHSPSRESYNAGDYFIQGFANAVTYGKKQIAKSVGKTFSTALTVIKSAVEDYAKLSEEATSIDFFNGVSNKTAFSSLSSRLNSKNNASGNSQVTNNDTKFVTNNFYQTNNSPKSLSRLDIYRQSKNLLNYKGG